MFVICVKRTGRRLVSRPHGARWMQATDARVTFHKLQAPMEHMGAREQVPQCRARTLWYSLSSSAAAQRLVENDWVLVPCRSSMPLQRGLGGLLAPPMLPNLGGALAVARGWGSPTKSSLVKYLLLKNTYAPSIALHVYRTTYRRALILHPLRSVVKRRMQLKKLSQRDPN